MRFTSLSDAIKYHSKTQNALANVPPYGTLAAEVAQVPLNTNYIAPPTPNVLTYGKSIWGIGKITDISEPLI